MLVFEISHTWTDTGHRMNVMDIHSQSTGKKDNLNIRFESKQQIHNILYRVSLSDLLKIKYNNQQNKIIRDFLDSLTCK